MFADELTEPCEVFGRIGRLRHSREILYHGDEGIEGTLELGRPGVNLLNHAHRVNALLEQLFPVDFRGVIEAIEGEPRMAGVVIGLLEKESTPKVLIPSLIDESSGGPASLCEAGDIARMGEDESVFCYF